MKNIAIFCLDQCSNCSLSKPSASLILRGNHLKTGIRRWADFIDIFLLIYENKRLQVEISEFLGGCTRSVEGNRVNRNWKKAKILTDEEQFDEFTIWI